MTDFLATGNVVNKRYGCKIQTKDCESPNELVTSNTGNKPYMRLVDLGNLNL